MTPAETFWLLLGTGFFVAGFALLAAARRSSEPVRRIPVVGRISRSTETAAGLVFCFVGYHIAAYGGPGGWIVFRVPDRFGWIVFVGGAVGLIGAAIADRMLGIADAESDE